MPKADAEIIKGDFQALKVVKLDFKELPECLASATPDIPENCDRCEFFDFCIVAAIGRKILQGKGGAKP